MSEFTRRAFITRTSIGVVASGVAVTAASIAPLHMTPVPQQPNPALSTLPIAPSLETSVADVSLSGPMLVHVRDVATAEIGVLIGTQELVYRDPELVARLVSTAGHAARMAG